MGKAKQSSMQNCMDSIDLYGSKVYSYNFEGRQNINSLMGTLVSIGVYLFIIIFIKDQILVMVRGDNPTVSTQERLDVHTKVGTNIDLDKDGFFFAVGVRNYLSDEYKDSLSTTRAAKVDMKENKNKRTGKFEVQAVNKPYSYLDFVDPTGPNPFVKWEARVFEGDGANSKVI